MDFFKNLKPIQFYFISMMALGLANVTRNFNSLFYGIMVGIGVIAFSLGIYVKFKK